MDRRDPCRPHVLGDLRSLRLLQQFRGQFHARGRLVPSAQHVGLRIGARPQVRPSTAGIRLAGEQQLFESIGAPERIRRFEQFEHGGVTQPGRPMHARMLARHEFAQFAMLAGHLESFAQAGNHLDSRLLVPDVPRPLLRRRNALAEIVHERCESHGGVVRQFAGDVQYLKVLVKRADGGYDEKRVLPVRFVPLVPGKK